jgi:hypothetical protein
LLALTGSPEAPVHEVVRTTGHVTRAAVVLAILVAVSAAVAGQGAVVGTWALPTIGVLAASAALGAHLTATVRIVREEVGLRVCSRVTESRVRIGTDDVVEFRYKHDGEFWPRIECHVVRPGGSSTRIPASGVELRELASLI